MKNFLLLIALFGNTVLYSQTKNITVDFNTPAGTGKQMTGVNTGPNSIVSGTTEQCLNSIGNHLIRTHDYHGPCDYWGYTNFFNYFNQTFNYSFQPHLTSGYNWTTTDAQIAEITDAGFQPFFRVGISFPGAGPSPASPMPKDADGINFKTFAGIAKRTAMHYTAGWNNGFNYTIPYWEIWNEPNNNASWIVDSAQAYYRLYQQCADSLKSFNPQLKVGGPAAAKNAFYAGGIHYTINQNYVSNFLNFCQTNSVPLDFYSFHMYDKKNPYHIKILVDTLSYYLNQYGFSNTELVVSETNINTGGYDNTAKGCSYLTSSLISVVNTRLSNFIWYRGVDLNPLCNSDIGNTPSFTLNGYAYKFFNEVNDSTPVFIQSAGNEFNADNVNDSLNNVMILSGKNNANTQVKVLISNHESIYSDISLTLQNLPWSASDNISVVTETINSSGYQTSTTSVNGAATLTYNIPAVGDASVFLITFEYNPVTALHSLAATTNTLVYPNPAGNNVAVNTNLKKYTLRLTDTFGRVFFEQQNKQEIDLTNIPDGLYFIQIQDETRAVENIKLVVAK